MNTFCREHIPVSVDLGYRIWHKLILMHKCIACTCIRNRHSCAMYIMIEDSMSKLYLTDLSSDPEAAYAPSTERATDKTLSECPSNVLSTPVVAKSQLLSVLSQDEVTRISEVPCSPSTSTVDIQDTMSLWPSILTRWGPPGMWDSGWSGVRRGAISSKAVITRFCRIGLRKKETARNKYYTHCTVHMLTYIHQTQQCAWTIITCIQSSPIHNTRVFYVRTISRGSWWCMVRVSLPAAHRTGNSWHWAQ